MLDDDRFFVDNLDAALATTATPHAWRQRWATLLATLVVCAAVLALVVTRDARSMPVIPTGARYAVELSSDTSWGTFTITGSQGHNTFTASGTAMYTAPATLTIRLDASPFAPTTCRLTLPPAAADTCRGLSPFVDATPDAGGVTHLPLHFRLTSADLPPPMGQALVQEVAQQVLANTPRVRIPLGSHYAVGGFQVAHYVAQQSLTATLVSARGDPQHSPDATCPVLCGADVAAAQPTTQHIWHARIFIDQQWRISDAAGTALGSIHESALPRPFDLELAFDAATEHWSIVAATDLGQGMCDDGDIFLQNFFYGTGSGFTNFTTRPSYTDRLLAGCLLHLPTLDGSATADFLWRLGSLYAVNAAAHTAAPSLTVVTPGDLAALG